MSKFGQALIIVILVALAAQVVLASVQPLVPYAIVAGILFLVGGLFLRRVKRK